MKEELRMQKETREVCVRNLDVTVNESQLKELFQTVGQVGMVTIPKDHDGQHKGYAYIELNSEESKNRAISSLNGQKICGKEIYVEPKRTNVSGYNKMKHSPFMNMLGMFYVELDKEEALKWFMKAAAYKHP